MPIYTTLISGSTGQSLSGSFESIGFVKAIGVGNSSSIDLAVTTPELSLPTVLSLLLSVLT